MGGFHSLPHGPLHRFAHDKAFHREGREGERESERETDNQRGRERKGGRRTDRHRERETQSPRRKLQCLLIMQVADLPSYYISLVTQTSFAPTWEKLQMHVSTRSGDHWGPSWKLPTMYLQPLWQQKYPTQIPSPVRNITSCHGEETEVRERQ